MDARPDDPAQLGKYRIVGRLGTDGALGRVYAGEDPTGRPVALRVIPEDLARDAGFRERFRREVQAAAAAPPWFVAAVLDADADAERPWVATARVDGPSLRTYVGEQGPLGEAGVSALAVRMADGLAALHATGLVHRDLRPSNVILAEDGPRLIDFGIARAADAGDRTGRSIGTPEYLSPEQAAGASAVGPASDMFTFGSLLAYAATGRSPFAGDSAAASLHRVVEAEPDLTGLDGVVRDAVALCLDKDPARRATAGQLAGFLRTAEAAAAARTVAVPAVRPLPAPPPGAAPSGMAAPTLVSAAPPPYPPPQAVAFDEAPPRRSQAMWVPVIAIAVLAALVAGGIALVLTRSPAAVGGSASPSAGAPADPGQTPPPAAGGVTGSDPAAGTTPVDPSTFGVGGPRFASPSRNISCLMSADGGGSARCDVTNRTWTLPPQPPDCTLAFGQGAQVVGPAPGTLTCAGDTVSDPALTMLQYGQSVTFNGIVCVSRDTGIRCTNTGTGHGFRVSRGAYELF
jgi:eukaryotic-like serine/threonine-protein kinase